GEPAHLAAEVCPGCRHVYRTKFVAPVDQTGMFPTQPAPTQMFNAPPIGAPAVIVVDAQPVAKPKPRFRFLLVASIALAVSCIALAFCLAGIIAERGRDVPGNILVGRWIFDGGADGSRLRREITLSADGTCATANGVIGRWRIANSNEAPGGAIRAGD